MSIWSLKIKNNVVNKNVQSKLKIEIKVYLFTSLKNLIVFNLELITIQQFD